MKPAIGSAVVVEKEESVTSSDNPFFDHYTEDQAEIVEGLFREGQLIVLGGAFGVGKSPLIADLTVHLLNGIPWCGRLVQKRPVIGFDFENSAPSYKGNIKNICSSLKCDLPRIPDQLEIYLEHGSPEELATKMLLEIVKASFKRKLEFIREAVAKKPNALVVIDPLEMFFRIDTLKKTNVLELYTELRLLLSRFPESSILTTFNLRKKDRHSGRVDLLRDPRGWLEEVCGSLDIMNRSDVRLGMDFLTSDEQVRVINGIRRGEEMQPLLIRPVGDLDKLAGFELSPADETDLKIALTSKQHIHWKSLPERFQFEEVANKPVPRASLHRLLKIAKSLGILLHENGVYTKVVKL